MNKFIILVSGLSLLISFGAGTPKMDRDARVLAFPGAEGFGKYTTGGRGGKVLIVSNLNDSGPGSFRSAVEENYPRIIVFNISGTIPLESQLKIRNGDITIAGQSAPGDGICLKNYGFHVNADNLIIRYLRIRMGNEKNQQDDCISVIRQKDIIIDHCSFSWGTDEVATAYDNEDFTMQWCIISESLNNSVHEKGEHGYGGIWGGKGASFHHNLLAHHKSRLPRFCGARYHKQSEKEIVDFTNNVIYNWKSNSSYGGEEGNHNVVNNHYRAGPATEKSKRDRILNPWSPYGKFYVSGNVLHGNQTITEENYLGITADYLDSCLSDRSVEVMNIDVQSAEIAFHQTLEKAGASLKRDEVDTRVVQEVLSGTAHFGIKMDGIIDSQAQVGGWPELRTFGEKNDSDQDGMPDVWERENGLNPQDNEDNNLYSLDQFYTNIEVYLNNLVD